MLAGILCPLGLSEALGWAEQLRCDAVGELRSRWGGAKASLSGPPGGISLTSSPQNY